MGIAINKHNPADVALFCFAPPLRNLNDYIHPSLLCKISTNVYLIVFQSALGLVRGVPRASWAMVKLSNEDLVTMRVNLGDISLLIFNVFIALSG